MLHLLFSSEASLLSVPKSWQATIKSKQAGSFKWLHKIAWTSTTHVRQGKSFLVLPDNIMISLYLESCCLLSDRSLLLMQTDYTKAPSCWAVPVKINCYYYHHPLTYFENFLWTGPCWKHAVCILSFNLHDSPIQGSITISNLEWRSWDSKVKRTALFRYQNQTKTLPRKQQTNISYEHWYQDPQQNMSKRKPSVH